MKLNVDIVGIAQARDMLGGLQDKRFAYNIAQALTQTAVEAKPALQREMRDVFDRPTRFTIDSVYVKPATIDNLVAEVGIKNEQAGVRPATHWLRWQVYGGLRRMKAFEKLLVSGGFMRNDQRAVPGQAAKLDAFGNISVGQIVQILSQLRLEAGGGSNRAMARVEVDDNAKTVVASSRCRTARARCCRVSTSTRGATSARSWGSVHHVGCGRCSSS
jgi:hypothetical protein